MVAYFPSPSPPDPPGDDILFSERIHHSYAERLSCSV